ncbi:MAG: hypothetical protein R3B96_25425 [Pirellulaceae bacterium]
MEDRASWFSPNRITLTNHHVIMGAESMDGADSTMKLYPWRLIGTDPGGDLAVIRLLGRDDFPYSPIGDSSLVSW